MKPLPDVIYCVLAAIIECGGEASETQITVVSGYSKGTFGGLKHMMQGAGLLAGALRYGWIITERGKIALAIEMGQRARARSAGRQRKAMSIRKFRQLYRGGVLFDAEIPKGHVLDRGNDAVSGGVDQAG